MPFYTGIKRFTIEERERTTERLLRLRRKLQKEIPHKTANDTLLLATWNIRDFDSNKWGHGSRLPESLYYIAEVLSAFDLVALQEINKDLAKFKKLMRILGPDWNYISTDETMGVSGNKERMVYIYDRRKVDFQNIAGEIVLPQTRLVRYIQKKKKKKDDEVEKTENSEAQEYEITEHRVQFARTPFMVAFQAGWFKFMLCTVHIYYGADYGDKLDRRKEEIRQIAKEIADKADGDPEREYILLGDFNIVDKDHETMQALKDQGFIIPDPIRDFRTNFKDDKFYDQIAFREKWHLPVKRGTEVELKSQLTSNSNKTNTGGVFNFFRSVFTNEEYEVYKEKVDEAKKRVEEKDEDQAKGTPEEYYRNKWRTFQMSDHLPLWVELNIDFTDRYLKKLVAEK